MWGWHDWSWGGWLVMTLTMLVIWGLLAWLLISILRPDGSTQSRDRSPEDVLAERFARGEIDEEEYRRRLKTLGETRPPSAEPGAR
jgi:putative membrane protein